MLLWPRQTSVTCFVPVLSLAEMVSIFILLDVAETRHMTEVRLLPLTAPIWHCSFMCGHHILQMLLVTLFSDVMTKKREVHNKTAKVYRYHII